MKFLILVLAIVGSSTADRGSRIVFGLPAFINQFPHQAYIVSTENNGTNQFGCGGSLISSKWILTAGHCIIPDTQIEVLLGSVDAKNGVKRNATRSIVFPTFDPATLKDDIALIELDEELDLNQTSPSIVPIQLPRKSEANKTYVNDILTVSGFGKTSISFEPIYLRYVLVQGISNDRCRQTYRNINANVLCTRGLIPYSAGTCSGDSGGPLIKGKVLVGVVSFGGASCTTSVPKGFTRVGPYLLNFINKNTGIPIED